MFSYIFAGMTGLLVYQKHNSIEWRDSFYFQLAAAPSSFLGSYALTKIGGFELQIICYSLVLISAVFSLIQTIRGNMKETKEANSVETPVSTNDAVDALEVCWASSTRSTTFSADDRLSHAFFLQNADQDAPYALTASDDDPPPVAEGKKKTPSRIFIMIAGAIDGFGSALTGAQDRMHMINQSLR
jgi:hypothetical protein